MQERAWMVDRQAGQVYRYLDVSQALPLDRARVRSLLLDADTASSWEYAVALAIGMDWTGYHDLAEACMRPLADLLRRHRFLCRQIITERDCASLVMIALVRSMEGQSDKESQS